MTSRNIREFFRTAFGLDVTPFDYQARLAGDKDGTACESKLINVPTGCGQIAAVVLAWLWNRVALPSLNSQPRVAPKRAGEGGSTLNSSAWPCLLLYCLPMRKKRMHGPVAASTFEHPSMRTNRSLPA